MLTVELTVLVGFVSTLFGMFFTLRSHSRANEKDLIERTKSEAILSAKLTEISTNVHDIKHQLRDQSDEIKDVSNRVTRLYESNKSAHLRIDELSARIKEQEGKEC